jgi:DNA-binding transcriptional MerR regulator
MMNPPGSLAEGAVPIGEAARLTGLETHVIRRWDDEYHLVRPARRASGRRLYSPADLDALRRCKELVYGRGFTPAGAKKYLRHAADSPEMKQAREARSVLGDVKREVARLIERLGKESDDDKIYGA